MSTTSDRSEFETNDEFYFESDHVALRSNGDYRAMLKYILGLEYHKIMLIKDIEKLYSIKNFALQDTELFIEELKCGSIDFPLRYDEPNMPSINWSQYGIPFDNTTQTVDKTLEVKQENFSNCLVRGRLFDQSKPQTFNQLWTCEEQKRLEELLKQFPEEEIEMRRWSKIAEALGNRTPKQVMSRVQKYFLKLQRAGLPVPGRVRRGTTFKGAQKTSKVLQKKSTFFPSQEVPIFMEEIEEQSEEHVEYDESQTWTEVELLKCVYERRKIEEMSNCPLSIHSGISCCSCKCQSIIGTRWTDGAGSDWCSDCLIEFLPNTRMTPVIDN